MQIMEITQIKLSENVPAMPDTNIKLVNNLQIYNENEYFFKKMKLTICVYD